MAEDKSILEKSERWDRYQESLRKARKAYLADKKTITSVLHISEYEEVKEYCAEHGYSIQELIRAAVMEKVRS